MNQQFPDNTTSGWCQKQAALLDTISQEQMNAILWVLGHEVGHVTSWTPARMKAFYEQAAIDYKKQ